MSPPLPPSAVLSRYPPTLADARWVPLGTAGGFSGARVWRGRTTSGSEVCLKAHAPAADARRLESVLHPWMHFARTAGLDVVPPVEPNRDGRTVVEAAGRVWDVTGWMPGDADFHANPSDARLLAAVRAAPRARP